MVTAAAMRREKFAALNQFVSDEGGWIVSPPLDFNVEIEVLLGSRLPDLLRDGVLIGKDIIGRDIMPAPGCERILAAPSPEGGKPGTIVRTQRFSFAMPMA
jgi:hypothetical protein